MFAVAIGLMLGIFAVTALAQNTWVHPNGTPPNCTSGDPGCDAPLNVSKSLQTKLGQLLVNTATPTQNAVGMKVSDKSVFDTVQIKNGADAGKVLTSDSSGNASWKPYPLSVSPILYGQYAIPAPGGDIVTGSSNQLSLGKHDYCAMAGSAVSDLNNPTYATVTDHPHGFLNYFNGNWYIFDMVNTNIYREVSCFDVIKSSQPVTVTVTVHGAGRVEWAGNGSICSSSSGQTTTCSFPNNGSTVNAPVEAGFYADPIGAAYFGSPSTMNYAWTGWTYNGQFQPPCKGAQFNSDLCLVSMTQGGNIDIKAWFTP